MSLFNFNTDEMLTFFAVLVRYSVLIAVLPFFGDRLVPGPVKILFAFVLSVSLFPNLVTSGQIHPRDSRVWASSASGIILTIGLEVLIALTLGFVARLIFDGISFGANLVGNFMGFASASQFDPHQETHTEVIAQLQTTLAMLLFLSLDGHHLMLKTALESYRIVGLGRAGFNEAFSHKLIQMTAEVFRFGLQLAAPVAVCIFAVNIILGMMAKAMPQLNIFVLSFAISASIGFFVLLISMPEFEGAIAGILEKLREWLDTIMLTMAVGK